MSVFANICYLSYTVILKRLRMRHFISYLLTVLALGIFFINPSFSQSKKYSSWNAVTDDMEVHLLGSYDLYKNGDSDNAYKEINVAYYQFYEKIGFERTTQARISGNRAGLVELQFSACKNAITSSKSEKQVKAEIDKLCTMLREDAYQLDPKPYWGNIAEEMGKSLEEAATMYRHGKKDQGIELFNSVKNKYYQDSEIQFSKKVEKYLSADKVSLIDKSFNNSTAAVDKMLAGKKLTARFEKLGENLKTIAIELDEYESTHGWGAFWLNFVASISIILKEGFEAILIVGAILAYLVKSGKKESCKSVYIGSLIGVGASIIMAILLNALAGGQGDKQELIEGLTMIIATGVLFYTSNWMVSKSDAHQWEGYIKGQVAASAEKGSIFGLSFTAFLAVFREGAEIVLFYQALVLGATGDAAIKAIWTGLGIGLVLLFGVYFLIRFVSIKLPLKPFFLGTSIIMLLMCVAFVGSGISEFVEGDFVKPHILTGYEWLTVDLIGIHPYAETLIAQLLFLIPVITGFILQLSKMKKARENAINNIQLTVSPKKRGRACGLQIILGWFGIGNFYLGNIGKAVLQYSLTVFGLFFAVIGHGSLGAHPVFGKFFIAFGLLAVAVNVVWVIYEFVLCLSKKMKDGNGLPVIN